MINWMQAENRTITNAADRFTDEKLASMLLEKIAKANQTGVSVSALQE
jgi:sensor histidine kinase regulating citrate/malate metabolism